MRKPDPLPQSQSPAEDSDQTLFGSIGNLIEDGHTLLETELDYQRKRLNYGLARSKGIIGLVLLGLALLFFALMALIVGLLLALAPLLTAWGALAAVFGGIVVAAGSSFAVAAIKFRKTKAVILGTDKS
ncbi:phage holin family protein [Novosphingobium sp.]|uniref:phage holin family protein n=1 Tax=Novosphingobium sp. TaxID=1874826 RepID=UPI0025D5B2A3|nr:phage holin family protein [Novosphingobium sp.]